MEGTELKRKTFNAVIWALVRVGGSNVLSFGVFMVLARILSPHQFGLFALAILMVDIARIVSSAGLSDAIIRDKNRDEALAETAFWANLGLGAMIGALAWVLTPLYVSAINEPDIAPVLRTLALLVPVSALSGIHTACKLRDFGHKAIAGRTIATGALGGGAAIAAAAAGCGVWSLVIQTAVVDVAGVVFAWQSYPWWPKPRFDPHRLIAISGFTGTMMLSQVLGLLLTRMQDLVIGRYISVSAVGSYRIAWRMIDLIAQITIQPLVGVSFVTLSHLQDDPERFRAAFLRMLGMGALLTFPAMVGFAVLSDEIVVLLFGPKWAASAEIAKVLTLMAIPFCMNFFIGPALSAIGRSSAIARGAIVQTAATLLLSCIAAPYGARWVAAAYVFRAYLTMPYHLSLFKQGTGIGAFTMAGAILPPFLAALGMAVSLILVRPWLHEMLGHGLLCVTTSVLFGCLIFAVSLMLLAPRYVRTNVSALMPVLKGRRSEPAVP